jgi:hypothetical protein
MNTSTDRVCYSTADQTSCADEYAVTASVPGSLIAVMREGIVFPATSEIDDAELIEIGIERLDVRTYSAKG